MLREWPHSALDILSSITHLEATVMEHYGISDQDVSAYLSRMPADLATIVAALPDIHRERCGKQRWAEKTPGHLTHVATIRRLFPDAPIIRIVRDPRDVALSLVKMPWGPDTLAEAVDLWLKHDGASAAFFETDRASLTVGFEDLVARPVDTMKSICNSIDEPFQPTMLDTAKSAGHVNKGGEPWKERVRGPLDASRIGTWRSELSSEQQRLIEAMAGGRMIELGYAVENHFSYYCDVFPRYRVIDDALARVLAGRQFRTWKSRSNEPARLQMFLGNPDSEKWFSGGRIERLLSLCRLVVRVVRSRIHGTPIKWIHNTEETVESSKCARVAARLLNMTAEDSQGSVFPEHG